MGVCARSVWFDPDIERSRYTNTSESRGLIREAEQRMAEKDLRPAEQPARAEGSPEVVTVLREM
jgi:hypothetical protein